MQFTKDATYYANLVKRKEISTYDLVQQAFKNIEELDENINSVVHVQKELATNKAIEYDNYIEKLALEERNTLPPFYGVPILLKNLGQNQKGQPATSSSKLLKDNVANVTDNYIKDIENAGFIVVGRTNAPEFGFKGISDSEYYGRVNSPIDSSRNAGGSSGGAAAALKAGIVPIVTGSDGGGSIRMPASYNGLIGLKPTRGRIAVGPSRYRGWQGATIDFALTKSIRDTWALLKEVQIEQYDSPFIMPKIKEDDLVDLTDSLNIGYTTTNPLNYPVSEEALKAVENTAQALEKLGHKTTQVDTGIDGIKALQSYYIVNSVETAAMFDGIEENLGRKLTPYDVEPTSWGMYQAGKKIKAKEYSKVIAYWDQMAAHMEELFQKYDAVLLPTTNHPAPPHGKFDLDEESTEQMLNLDQLPRREQQDFLWKSFDVSQSWSPFTQQANLTGQPAISLPVYETKEGLPLGSQFWTGKGQEYLLLQIAKQLEDHGYLNVSIVSD